MNYNDNQKYFLTVSNLVYDLGYLLIFDDEVSDYAHSLCDMIVHTNTMSDTFKAAYEKELNDITKFIKENYEEEEVDVHIKERRMTLKNGQK